MTTKHTNREHKGYGTKADAFALQPASASVQIVLYEALLTNGSGGSIDMAVVKRLAAAKPQFLKKVAAAYTAVDLAVDKYFNANNDAFIVGAANQFSLVSFTVDDVDGGGGTYAIQYYNGSAFVTLTTYETPVFTGLGVVNLAFPPPVQWVVGGDTGDYDSDKYYVKIVSTGAPVNTAGFSSVWIGEILTYGQAVAANGSLGLSVQDAHKPYVLEQGEGIVPYFETAHAKNTVEVEYSTL